VQQCADDGGDGDDEEMSFQEFQEALTVIVFFKLPNPYQVVHYTVVHSCDASWFTPMHKSEQCSSSAKPRPQPFHSISHCGIAGIRQSARDVPQYNTLSCHEPSIAFARLWLE
jgi:hypothetical protein